MTTENPEALKEKRIVWDKDMLGKLSEHRDFLLKELERVNGQIRGVEADLFLLGAHIVSPPEYKPRTALDILKERMNKLNRK